MNIYGNKRIQAKKQDRLNIMILLLPVNLTFYPYLLTTFSCYASKYSQNQNAFAFSQRGIPFFLI